MADSSADPAEDSRARVSEENKPVEDQSDTRDGRIQELKQHTHELQLRLQNSEGHASWLLDWAIKRDRDGLLDAIAESTSAPSALAGPSLSTQAQRVLRDTAIKKSCFRFLDLPAEIRNRIYDLSANEAFRAPAKMSYLIRCVQEEYCDTDCLSHHDRLQSTPASRNRLAMLCVSRQVHEECRQLYYASMSLDLRHMYRKTTLLLMRKLLDSPFESKLQFVRHIEVEANVAQCLLFGHQSYYCTREVHHRWWEDHSSCFGNPLETYKLALKNIRRVRTLLFNLEAITICVGDDHVPGELHRSAIGLEMVINLIHLHTEQCNYLERLYPRLTDIVTMTEFGSERFKKVEQRQWALHYSNERLPSSLRSDLESIRETPNPRPLLDMTTGLMHSKTLANLGPQDGE